ncbi:MAG: hypothetical protein IKC99_00440 [Clostridia bacterium]|nr:hypothetical protein [Clostridia bacterium]
MDYCVSVFGADPSGQKLSTTAIQEAIDACAAAGGGRVVVPAGHYLIGTLWLRSWVELHLAHGAVLQASSSLADYNDEDAYPQNFHSDAEEWNGKHLIIAHECEQIAITGSGVIDGSGPAFYAPPIPWNAYCWREGLALAKDKKALRPGQMLAIIACNHVTIRDVTLQNATCWNCFLHGCSFVQVRGIKVYNPRVAANTDGIDIDTCRFVTVSDCIIDTGDDAIALRCDGERLSHCDSVCEYVTITNCVLSSSSSVFRIGVGSGTVRHVRVSNITIGRGAVGMMFMGYWTYGKFSHLHDIHFSDISAADLAHPLQIHGGAGATFSRISVTNYTAEAGAMTSICANEAGWMRDIRLQNIHVTLRDNPEASTERDFEDRGGFFFYAENAEGLVLENVQIDCRDVDDTKWRDRQLICNCPRLQGDITFYP